jgi:hypothetical protein
MFLSIIDFCINNAMVKIERVATQIDGCTPAEAVEIDGVFPVLE